MASGWAAFARADTATTWTGTAADSNWNTATNWSAGVPVAGTSYPVIPGSLTSYPILITSETIDNATLSAATSSLTIGNDTVLSINSGTAGGDPTTSDGNISNLGTIQLESAGSFTDVALMGSGTVSLSGAGNLSGTNLGVNRLYSLGTGVTLDNGSNITGAIQIGNAGNAFTLSNTGTINGSLSAGISLGSEASVTNTGTLEATGSGVLTLEDAITNTGGLISASSGSTVTLAGAAITGGTITNSAGTIQQSGNASSLAGSVTLNGTLTVVNANILNLNPGLTLTNKGTLSVASGGGDTDLDFAPTGSSGTVTLDGSGTISMGNLPENRIYTEGTSSTLVNNSTIEGGGQIGNAGNVFTLTNTGTINANLSTAMTMGGNASTTNTGTLEATNSGTLLLQNAITNTNGLISASGSGTVTLSAAAITGGTITNSGGTIQQSGNASSLAGSVTLNGTLTVVNANILNLNPALTLTNNGTVSLASSGSLTDLDFAPSGSSGTVTLDGSGTISMGNNLENRIYTEGTSSTLVNNSTIQGSGQIGTAGNAFALTNTGTIDANLSAGMTLGSDATTTNTGTLEATAGGTLLLSSVTITNTNGTISAGTGGTVTLSGAAITGGTITNSASTIQQSGGTSSLTGSITLNGTLTEVDGNALDLYPGLTLTNNGTLSVASSGSLTDLIFDPRGSGGTATLDGPGAISMSNNSNNRIYTEGASSTLTNNSTIQGSGQIGNAGLAFTFTNGANGLILANQSTSLLIGADAALTNNGTEQTDAGSLLQVTGTFTNFSGTTLTGGTYSNAGTFQFPNANIVTNQADIIMNGSGAVIQDQNSLNGLRNFATNGSSGSFTVENGATITTPGALSNAGTVLVTGPTASILNVSGGFTQTAGLTEVDAGNTLNVLSGVYAQSGGVTLVDGRLNNTGAYNLTTGTLKGTGTVSGGVDNTGGMVAPGDPPGTLDITGNYTQGTGGTLDIGLGGTAAGDFDVLATSGSANLAGTLDVTLLNGFTPMTGETFTILTAGSGVSGTFPTVDAPPSISVSYTTNSVVLNGITVPEPASMALLAVCAGGLLMRRRRALACTG